MSCYVQIKAVDNRRLVSSSLDQTIAVWKHDDGKHLALLRGKCIVDVDTKITEPYWYMLFQYDRLLSWYSCVCLFICNKLYCGAQSQCRGCNFNVVPSCS